jgi:multidrug efflux pump subunit AcrB
MFIQLKPTGQRGPHSSAEQVIARLRSKLHNVIGMTLYMQPAQDITIGGRVAKTQYQYTLVDVSQQELDAWAPRVMAALAKTPGLIDVTSDQATNGLDLAVHINREEAGRLGISIASIDNTLDDAFGQRVASKVYTTLNQYYVLLEVDPRFRDRPDALSSIYLRSAAGAPVPLSEVASVTETTTPLVVNHQGQFPSVTISFNLQPGAALGTAVTRALATVKAMHLPKSIQGGFQGTAAAYLSALSGQLVLIGAALIAIYLVLGMLYESFIVPITILSTLPSAGLGALLALKLVGMPLDIIGIIGIVLLIGIVKKNSIMMTDLAEAARKQGKTPLEAIREACLSRFRPILMTTVCAVLGGVPLMLGTGTGSEIRQPLGYTIVGGLLVSQVLTLYTTPVIYLYMDSLSRRLPRRRTRQATKPA